jgi:hypothetical protein
MKSRKSRSSVEIPTADAVIRGCEAFARHEPRDAMYRVATFLVAHFWGRPAEMADSLGVLLLTWNQSHYRFGSFDFSNLEDCIRENFSTLEGYRAKSILQYTPDDDPIIRGLFGEFLVALVIADGKSKGKRSPVAVAKALHLLAPEFFALWDKKIALASGCDYSVMASDRYISFMTLSQAIVRNLHSQIAAPIGKTLLKLIDEYSYSKYTTRWID